MLRKTLLILGVIFALMSPSYAYVLTSSDRYGMYQVFDLINRYIDGIDDDLREERIDEMLRAVYEEFHDQMKDLGSKEARVVTQLSKLLCIKSQRITGFACLENVFERDTYYDVPTSPDNYLFPLAMRRFIESQNRIRFDYGSSYLKVNQTLMETAQKYAQRLCDYDYFAHIGPLGSTTQSRIEESGYPYRYLGENLAEGYDNGELTTWQLWTSYEHRDTMLDPKFDEIGVGYCDKIWVVLYGKQQ